MNQSTSLERRVANLEKMILVTQSLRAAFNLQSLLVQIMDSIVELVDCEKSSILLVHPQTNDLYFASASGTQFDRLKNLVVPRRGSIAGSIVETRQPIVVGEAQGDSRFFAQVDRATGQHTETLMGVPMEIGGRVIGVLEAVNKNNDGQFDHEDVETLLMFAPQAAAAIENTRLIEEQRQRLADAALIEEAILTLSRFIEKDQLLDQLADLLQNTLDYACFSIWEADPEAQFLTLSLARGLDEVSLPDTLPVDAHSAIGLAALHLDTIHIVDIQQESSLPAFMPTTHSVLAVPMLCGEDMVGVIGIESERMGIFGEREQRILFQIALQAAIGMRQASLYETSRRANRLKQEFITTMSHELRTPMTVIISSCDMVARETLGALNDAQKSALKTALERANLLLRLLNDVLDFSKIASGDLKLYPTTVSLPLAVQSTMRQYQVYADRKKQTVSVDIPADCQYVLAEDKRLRQILGHLLDNAIKFSPEGRPILIRASLHDADFVRIDVIDQGIGIRPQDQELIFEDFRQLDNSFTREYGGAGMGLAISKHLARLQGGMLWVQSELGQGSTFSFILPRPNLAA